MGLVPESTVHPVCDHCDSRFDPRYVSLLAGITEMTLEYKDIKNRKGKFAVSLDFVTTRPDLVQKILGRCIVFKSEYLLMYDVIEYFAISELFDEIEEGMAAEQYRFVFKLKLKLEELDEEEENLYIEKVEKKGLMSTEKIQWI